MLKTSFIVNSKTTDTKSLEKEIVSYCQTHKIPFEIKLTLTPGDAILLTEDAIKSGSRLIVAMGGDGTFNEVLNGLIYSNTNETVLFSGMPCGTANDFCKTLKMPASIEELFSCLDKQQIKEIDIGKAEFYEHSGQKSERYFLNSSNVGFSAEVVDKVNNSKKYLGSKLTYLRAISSTILFGKTEEVVVKTKTESWNGKLFNISVCNGKFVGSGLQIAPQASLTDGLFSITLLRKFSFLDYLKYLPRVFKGEYLVHDSLTYMSADEISVEGLDNQLGVEMDGEFVGFSKAKFELLPAKLKVVFAENL